MNEEDLKRLQANVERGKTKTNTSSRPIKESGSIAPKKNKFGNKRVKDDLGNWWDSEGERDRWNTLQLLYRSGAITELRRQISFELNPGGTFSYKYKADFTYFENGVFVVEDFKGMKTPTFKKKSKLMKKVHGITIKLT